MAKPIQAPDETVPVVYWQAWDAYGVSAPLTAASQDPQQDAAEPAADVQVPALLAPSAPQRLAHDGSPPSLMFDGAPPPPLLLTLAGAGATPNLPISSSPAGLAPAGEPVPTTAGALVPVDADQPLTVVATDSDGRLIPVEVLPADPSRTRGAEPGPGDLGGRMRLPPLDYPLRLPPGQPGQAPANAFGRAWTVPPQNITVTFSGLTERAPDPSDPPALDANPTGADGDPSPTPGGDDPAPTPAADAPESLKRVDVSGLITRLGDVRRQARDSLEDQLGERDRWATMRRRLINPQPGDPPLDPQSLGEVVDRDELDAYYEKHLERLILGSGYGPQYLRAKREFAAAQAHFLQVREDAPESGWIAQALHTRKMRKARAGIETTGHAYDQLRGEAAESLREPMQAAISSLIAQRMDTRLDALNVQVGKLDHQLGRLDSINERLEEAEARDIKYLTVEGDGPDDIDRALSVALGRKREQDRSSIDHWAKEMLADRFSTIPKPGSDAIDPRGTRVQRKQKLGELERYHPDLYDRAEDAARDLLNSGDYDYYLAAELDRADMSRARRAEPDLQERAPRFRR